MTRTIKYKKNNLNTRRHFKVKTNKYKNKCEVLIKYKT